MNQEQQTQDVVDQKKILCPQCESTFLTNRQCKSICESCGYVESCEDNFVPNQDNPIEC